MLSCFVYVIIFRYFCYHFSTFFQFYWKGEEPLFLQVFHTLRLIDFKTEEYLTGPSNTLLHGYFKNFVIFCQGAQMFIVWKEATAAMTALGPRAENLIIPLYLTQLFCPGFTLAEGPPSGFTTDRVGCWGGSPVESLQSHISHLWTWVPCDGKQTGSPLDQWDMVRMKWDCRLSTIVMIPVIRNSCPRATESSALFLLALYVCVCLRRDFQLVYWQRINENGGALNDLFSWKKKNYYY